MWQRKFIRCRAMANLIEARVLGRHQSHSEDATDTDVPAEEGQAEEGVWELFTGQGLIVCLPDSVIITRVIKLILNPRQSRGCPLRRHQN